ncbi:MAG: glutaminase A [Bacteroidales bacterium]
MRREISIKEFESVMMEAYNLYKDNKDGENASYIPYLEKVPNDLFGISITFTDGRSIQVGDTNYEFGIESISKVLTAILAMRQAGDQAILDKIGADATGLPFNSIMALLVESQTPSTPLVNAGAISACSMIHPIGNIQEKWNAITQNMQELCGSPLNLIEDLYISESETNYNNRSITWLLKNLGRIYDEPEMSLDLYTKQCSLGVSTNQLAICASTIANQGINPANGHYVFDPLLATKIISLIATFGFYEKSGEWIFTTGLPVKTGVGGGIMGVLPGVFGIAAFAPPIDSSGNSVKAQLALRYIMNKLDLHIYSNQQIIVTE